MEQILVQISPLIRELLTVSNLCLSHDSKAGDAKKLAYELSTTAIELYMTEIVRKKEDVFQVLNMENQWLRESWLKNLVRLLKNESSKELESSRKLNHPSPYHMALLYLYFKAKIEITTLERIFDSSHIEFIQDFFCALESVSLLSDEEMNRIFNYRCPRDHKVMALNWWPLKGPNAQSLEALFQHKKNCPECREMEEEAMLLQSLLDQYFQSKTRATSKSEVESIAHYIHENYLQKKTIMSGISKWFDQTF